MKKSLPPSTGKTLYPEKKKTIQPTWIVDKEREAWRKTFSTMDESHIDDILKRLTYYHEHGLNAYGISDVLMNIAIFCELPSNISTMRTSIPRIRKALQRAHTLALELQGDDLIASLHLAISEVLRHVAAIEARSSYYDANIVRVRTETKRPPKENVYIFEGVLISYFERTGFCSSEAAACEEVRGLIQKIGHPITLRQVKEAYFETKKCENSLCALNSHLKLFFGFIPQK